MCGIFGVVGQPTGQSLGAIRSTIDALFTLSESRGKESAGLAIRTPGELRVLKSPIPASALIRSGEYRRLIDSALKPSATPLCMIGHSRLVTNGSENDNYNNQPVVKAGLVGIHNGIIVNDDALWKANLDLSREFAVDTEILLALIRKHLATASLVDAVRQAFAVLEGAASVALLLEDRACLVLATNTGSMYRSVSTDGKSLVFASERYILEQLLKTETTKSWFNAGPIEQIAAREGLVIDLGGPTFEAFSLTATHALETDPAVTARVTVQNEAPPPAPPTSPSPTVTTGAPREYERIARSIAVDPWNDQPLMRCTRCILPQTMPFIAFDDNGVCNFCRSYRKIELIGENALRERVDAFRSKTSAPDCIVTFSGGRDSSYGLHYIKTVLGLKPIAYSYDWGMITDLGRRNQARMCGKLGVEHLLVSADIRAKRSYIRKNVSAWLRQPDLGMVPLFMAGDKQYFYYANKLREQTGIQPVILCENLLERTDFKSGYCGIAPTHSRGAFYRLPLVNNLKLAAYYARQYLANPAYINASLVDTVFAYFAYYLMQHDFLSLFHYVKWDENEIMDTLRREYNWELASDTTSSWRIGDGTAAFYNYIYYWVAGFTEHDTFRSNQIREGMITRDQALALARDGNQPRVESMDWYCQTIGLDLEEVLRVVRQIPRLKIEAPRRTGVVAA